MTTVAALQTWIQPVVEAWGCELWGIEYKPSGEHSLLRVYIDKTDGVTLEDCEQISHQVGAVLDVEDLISSKYRLEISSPGLNRKLFTWEQIARYCGEKAIVRMQRPIEGRRKFLGQIESATRDFVTLLVDGQAVSLPLDDIEKAHLVQIEE